MLKKAGSDVNLLIEVSAFIMNFAITRALIPGKVENWISIFDMKGVGITEVPKKII